MSSVSQAPDTAQARILNHPEPFEAAGVNRTYRLILAAMVRLHYQSHQGAILDSFEEIAAAASVSPHTLRRCIALFKSIDLITCQPKGVPGHRGGRGESEYRFNESHSLWKFINGKGSV